MTGSPRAEEASATPEGIGLRTQIVRFVIAGGISAVVDFGVLALLMRFGVGYVTAKAVSFVCGTTTAYLINNGWTFTTDGTKRKRRFAGVLVLYGLTFVLQVGVFAALYPWLVSLGLGGDPQGWVHPAQVIAFVVAQGIATTVNFIVQRTVIFR